MARGRNQCRNRQQLLQQNRKNTNNINNNSNTTNKSVQKSKNPKTKQISKIGEELSNIVGIECGVNNTLLEYERKSLSNSEQSKSNHKQLTTTAFEKRDKNNSNNNKKESNCKKNVVCNVNDCHEYPATILQRQFFPPIDVLKVSNRDDSASVPSPVDQSHSHPDSHFVNQSKPTTSLTAATASSSVAVAGRGIKNNPKNFLVESDQIVDLDVVSASKQHSRASNTRGESSGGSSSSSSSSNICTEKNNTNRMNNNKTKLRLPNRDDCAIRDRVLQSEDQNLECSDIRTTSVEGNVSEAAENCQNVQETAKDRLLDGCDDEECGEERRFEDIAQIHMSCNDIRKSGNRTLGKRQSENPLTTREHSETRREEDDGGRERQKENCQDDRDRQDNRAHNDRACDNDHASINCTAFIAFPLCGGSSAASMGQKSTKDTAGSRPGSARTSRESTPTSRSNVTALNTASAVTGRIVPGVNNDIANEVAASNVMPFDGNDTDSVAVNTSPTNNAEEEFYDFEDECQQQQLGQQAQQQAAHKETIHGNCENRDIFIGSSTLTPRSHNYRLAPPSSNGTLLYGRYVPAKLEDVPEYEEEEEEEEQDDDGVAEQEAKHSQKKENEDCEFGQKQKQPQPQSKHSSSRTPERNLSASCSDSGIGSDSRASSPFQANNGTAVCFSSMPKAAHRNLTFQKAQLNVSRRFARDSTSTSDGDDSSLAQHDEVMISDPNDDEDEKELNDIAVDGNKEIASSVTISKKQGERLVCIESISLPDVVVQSTNTGTTASGEGSSNFDNDTETGNCHILNINGGSAHTNSGNVHFIPIHVEGQSRKQSKDDSGIKRNNNVIIEITEDDTENYQDASSFVSTLKQELDEQKKVFNGQLSESQRTIDDLQVKINDLKMKIENLEQELSAKTWNVERLQAELCATQIDDNYVRKKLKLVEDEKDDLRQRYNEWEDEYKRKYDELDTQHRDLTTKFELSEERCHLLMTQLDQAHKEAGDTRQEIGRIKTDLEEQNRVLRNALENSENERKICEDRWQREFEMLRTHNMDHEETIMNDCEWQLRQMQKQCKERIDKVEHAHKKAVEKLTNLEEELEERSRKMNELKACEAEVNSLRGLISEQESSLQTLVNKIEQLKTELATAKAKYEEQLEEVEKIRIKCDCTIYDKEREMLHRIDEIRNDAAAFWEEKLYTELTRLKNELESVYVDERRNALDQLQNEHIEELRVLTSRYTSNEDELRSELQELQEQFEQKQQEFLDLREKSDNTVLQTRMHLERADHDYQVAMCREEEKREELELRLRKEFSEEKDQLQSALEKRLKVLQNEYEQKKQQIIQKIKKDHREESEQLRKSILLEKENALQEQNERHRKKISELAEARKEIELQHKRILADMKASYDADKAAADKRDISNASEIEQLHRKCRCLTNLFEEMRMRYERRDPRPEDLREIAELRSRCESQERDLYLLTNRLREMQLQLNAAIGNNVAEGDKGLQKSNATPNFKPNANFKQQPNRNKNENSTPQPHKLNTNSTQPQNLKLNTTHLHALELNSHQTQNLTLSSSNQTENVNSTQCRNREKSQQRSQTKKPTPKIMPTNCDVIFEENEDHEEEMNSTVKGLEEDSQMIKAM